MREQKREIEGEIAWKRKNQEDKKISSDHTVTGDRGSNKVTWTYLLEYY